MDLNKRFWSKIDIKGPDECWEYKESKIPQGYGQFWTGIRTVYAHRFAWESFNKCKIPEGKLILHNCDNPSCCNPKHLYTGTHSDNMQDMLRRGRGNLKRKTLKLARMSAKDIVEIRKYRWKFSECRVGKMFNVNHSTIRHIWDSDKYPCKEGYYV